MHHIDLENELTAVLTMSLNEPYECFILLSIYYVVTNKAYFYILYSGSAIGLYRYFSSHYVMDYYRIYSSGTPAFAKAEIFKHCRPHSAGHNSFHIDYSASEHDCFPHKFFKKFYMIKYY